jgi:hypothetical protein
MANSRLDWIQKTRDGVVFVETFENPLFLSADGWTVLQGKPAQSLAQSKSGIASWDNAAVVPGTTTQSLPVAYVSVSDNTVSSNYPVCVWFYDTGDTTSPGPYFKILLSNGSYFSMGVRNSVSTSKYCYSVLGAGADNPTIASTTTRTIGWHSFYVVFTATTYAAYVDSNILVSATATVSNLQKLYLCSDVVGGPGPSFGYFDNLGYYRGIGIQVWFDPAVSTGAGAFYDSSNNYVGTASLDASNLMRFQPNLPGTIFPISYYFEIPAAVSTILLLRTTLYQFNPGDIYQMYDLNFGRKFDHIDTVPTSLANRNTTNFGETEVLQYGLKDVHSFYLKRLGVPSDKLTGDQAYKAARNWFQAAQSGNPFSVMADDYKENALGVVASYTQGGAGSTVTIMPNLGTNPTDAFKVGSNFIIRDNANTKKQEVTLATKGNVTLSFDAALNFDTNVGDYVYSARLYPFCEIGKNTLDGFKQSDERYKWYDWTQQFQEYNA